MTTSPGPAGGSPHLAAGHGAVPSGVPGHAAPTDAPDVSDASVGDLLGSVARDLSTLMRQELALARAELKQEAGRAGKAAGAFGGAGVAGHFVLLFVSLAVWAGLSTVMAAGWAALLVALVWAAIAGLLYTMGRSSMQRVDPKPERTVDTLSHIPDALRGKRGGTP
jgi:hypothetical protein